MIRRVQISAREGERQVHSGSLLLLTHFSAFNPNEQQIAVTRMRLFPLLHQSLSQRLPSHRYYIFFVLVLRYSMLARSATVSFHPHISTTVAGFASPQRQCGLIEIGGFHSSISAFIHALPRLPPRPLPSLRSNDNALRSVRILFSCDLLRICVGGSSRPTQNDYSLQGRTR